MEFRKKRFIDIDKPKRIKGLFSMIDLESLKHACKVLKGSGFKVYVYFLSQSPQEDWFVSPTNAENEWGIKRSTFYDGLEDLKNNGFFDGRVIHMDPESESEIRQEDPKIELKESENGYTNNINNNINNNASFSTSAEEALVSNKERIEHHTSKELDYALAESWSNWRDYVDDDGILTTSSNVKIKVIFDEELNK